MPEEPGTQPPRIVDLVGEDRERAVPVLRDSFVGIYRWHAKRTLFRISTVRAVVRGDRVVAVSMLERLAPEVSYVYYVAVARADRGRGLATVLVDDALARFRADGTQVVYAAVGEENAPSLALFRARGFRQVERKEPGYREGGLGAWGLRSRMMLVHGEILLGLRIGGSAPTRHS